MTPELQTLVSAASPVLLGVVAWFMRGMASDFKTVTATQQVHVTALALIESRVKRLEEENTLLRRRLDDIRGFAAKKGFQPREGEDD